MRRFWLSTSIASLLLTAGCDTSKLSDALKNAANQQLNTKHTIGAYHVEPPVTAVTPPKMFGASAAPATFQMAAFTTDVTSLVQTLQDRFFTPGPTYVKGILSDIDQRIDGLDKMAQQGSHKCLDAAPQTFNVDSPALAFPHYLQCIDNMGPNNTAGMFVAFGKKDDVFYVREGMNSGIGLMASVTGGTVEAWIMVADKDQILADPKTAGSESLMHLKALQSAGTLEFTVTGSGIGVGCGVQYRSNADFIYLHGRFADANTVPTDQVSVCAAIPEQEACLKTSDLSDSGDNGASCTAAGLDNFELPALDPTFVNYADIYKIGSAKLTGLTDFSEGATGSTAP